MLSVINSTDKNGKIKEWKIKVENRGDHSAIVCTYGYKNGKMQTSTTIVRDGKNIGRKNQTSHYEQAVLDAESKWTKQSNKKNTADIVPMLAHKYSKSKVAYPCFVQPKLDGYRMMYDSTAKKIYTRTGKEYSVLYDTELYKQLLSINIYLDGELYVHDSNYKFENYGVLRHKTVPDSDIPKLNTIDYHVYDVIDETLPFSKRIEIIRRTKFPPKIKPVETLICNNESELDKAHIKFTTMGYEGSIIRNANGMYIKHRSYDLLKRKDFDDTEYTITGFTCDKDENIIWTCKTDTGIEFNVPSKGTVAERKTLYSTANLYIGKQLSVQHFGLTADGVPRFPKTLRAGVASIRGTAFP